MAFKFGLVGALEATKSFLIEINVGARVICDIAQVSHYLFVFFCLFRQGFILGDEAIQANYVLVRGWLVVSEMHLRFPKYCCGSGGLRDVEGTISAPIYNPS